jgi:hypothetical protein
MKLDMDKHRIVRYLAQQLAANRTGVSEATLALSLGMEMLELREHIDALEGTFLSAERRVQQSDNRWLTLSRDGQDYAHKHGII